MSSLPELAGSSSRNPARALPPAASYPLALLPGVVLSAMAAAVAFSLRELPGIAVFSPMILAVIAGMVFSNVVGMPAQAKAGVAFCQRSLLRLAIVLLGFQLTIGQVTSIGAAGIGVVALTLVATFLFTVFLGRLIGVERGLASLIAAGTSICGASAIVAANSVVAGRDEDVAYAVAAITLFGTIAMFLLPALAPLLDLDQHRFGLWAGAAIHEVAQVVGAGFQYGAAAGETGTVAKLARVAMLAPMLVALGFCARRSVAGGTGARAPVPWFVFAFIGTATLNSVVEIPAEAKAAAATVTTMLLSIGLAALGLQADIGEIRSRGLRPLILALSAFLFIAGFTLSLVKLVL
ncbi:YeiH family protein [Mesorhizobium sp. L-8-3]|uniref:YeiH family protein n=1 Tax=unclassified Mesorhizobium TaxID=325217 RepID=UPI00406CA0C6